MNTFFDDNLSLPGDCTDSPFVDRDQNHFITGNLNIIDNNRLRKILSKDLNFHEHRIAGASKSSSSFSDCRRSVISVIDEKLSNLPTKVITEKIKNTVKLKD